MILPEWHPDDERLLNRYLDRSAADPSLERHLAACPACTARCRVLERTLEDMYHDVASNADAVFPPGRLEAQRRSILARLGQREGRVLPFPEPMPRGTPRVRLAVAAALILMTTTGLLRILGGQPRVDFGRSESLVAESARPLQASARQEAVYLDIEVALASHGTAELQALDELTPRATGMPTSSR